MAAAVRHVKGARLSMRLPLHRGGPGHRLRGGRAAGARRRRPRWRPSCARADVTAVRSPRCTSTAGWAASTSAPRCADLLRREWKTDARRERQALRLRRRLVQRRAACSTPSRCRWAWPTWATCRPRIGRRRRLRHPHAARAGASTSWPTRCCGRAGGETMSHLVRLELKAGLGRHLRAGHPWVFKKALGAAAAASPPGSVVDLVDGRPLRRPRLLRSATPPSRCGCSPATRSETIDAAFFARRVARVPRRARQELLDLDRHRRLPPDPRRGRRAAGRGRRPLRRHAVVKLYSAGLTPHRRAAGRGARRRRCPASRA